jgi:hypothetical protein
MANLNALTTEFMPIGGRFLADSNAHMNLKEIHENCVKRKITAAELKANVYSQAEK